MHRVIKSTKRNLQRIILKNKILKLKNAIITNNVYSYYFQKNNKKS